MRYYLSGNNVIFPKHNFIFHCNFGNTYYNYSIVRARRKLKTYYTRSQQDDIIHYLKEQKYIIV
jgi:hypothetical protein